MKKILFSLSLIIFAFAAQASSIQVTSPQRQFTTYSSILSADVSTAEDTLRVFMEDKMRCSRVRLNLNIIKDAGVFSKGIFTLNLSADCDKSIGNFQLDFDASCKNSGEAVLIIQYSKSGQSFSKQFIVQNSESCQE